MRMVTGRQAAILVLLGGMFWLSALAYLRGLPQLLTDPFWNPLNFASTVSVAWTAVYLIRRLAGLAPEQLMAGVGLVGAVVMAADGLVLNWFPRVYGPDDTVSRLAGAWLLWGYGFSLAAALLMARTAKGAAASGDGSPSQSHAAVTPP
ncbi:hypothetical protein UAJ10_04360 [Nitrospirillum sp. BR 11164]|uniref:hypothetical protein n=1 Tax=Nitrospirillum sp. BR 11164 TaxID=3104324 RepID=UPI002AFEB167|nr:hypothetical protein [Nitrospirillum sp. BR 11164]MEA1648248.1 hypothetical protein [Nitrospirillum sp. BR 11164]